jgi:hypothetical protein
MQEAEKWATNGIFINEKFDYLRSAVFKSLRKMTVIYIKLILLNFAISIRGGLFYYSPRAPKNKN